MKKVFFLFLFIPLSFFLWNCEKDDLCGDGTPTTPQVVVSFYDQTNTDALKSVTNLLIKEVVSGDTLVANAALESSDINRFLFNSSKISFPLRTNGTVTEYQLIFDHGNTNIIDTIRFEHDNENIYISRACGYKTVFKITNGTTLVTTTNWINSYTLVNHLIETENESHLKIYF